MDMEGLIAAAEAGDIEAIAILHLTEHGWCVMEGLNDA